MEKEEHDSITLFHMEKTSEYISLVGWGASFQYAVGENLSVVVSLLLVVVLIALSSISLDSLLSHSHKNSLRDSTSFKQTSNIRLPSLARSSNSCCVDLSLLLLTLTPLSNWFGILEDAHSERRYHAWLCKSCFVSCCCGCWRWHVLSSSPTLNSSSAVVNGKFGSWFELNGRDEREGNSTVDLVLFWSFFITERAWGDATLLQSGRSNWIGWRWSACGDADDARILTTAREYCTWHLWLL